MQIQPHFDRPGRVLVVGLGRSGKAALELCLAGDREVVAYDQNGGAFGDVQVYAGATIPDQALQGVGTVVMSPGVDPRPVRARMEAVTPQAQMTGEMGLALATAQRYWPHVKTVLITGTNGKSTVTDLCAHLLRLRFADVFAGGNLGIPLSQKVVEIGHARCAVPSAWVLECSSYQLETLGHVHAQVAMLLNVSPDHLDRYRDMEHYAQIKAKIFEALGPSDLALLDAEDPRTPALSPQGPQAHWVQGVKGPRWLQTPEGPEPQGLLHLGPGLEIPRAHLRLPGRHNAKNAIFALLAARHLGVDLREAPGALERYAGLDHRMQWVAQIEDVAYYNDSKATNVASVQAGLAGFPRPFVLICGGQAKQGDDPFDLAPMLRERCRALVGIGRDGNDFVRMAASLGLSAHRRETLSQAVELATQLAQSGDAVVLSPACASWDQYPSYAARGEDFARAVQQLGDATL